MPSTRAAADRRPLAAFLAILALAFIVAAAVKRDPPDFSVLPPIAIVRDDAQRPLWAIRLAGASHQIAADSQEPAPPAAGHAYQLWLVVEDGAHSLGLLPLSGRKVIPEIPALAARLGERGELLVTLEPARGSDTGQPSGPVMFRAVFPIAAPGKG
jgi:anti-sigma-K factor RskA